MQPTSLNSVVFNMSESALQECNHIPNNRAAFAQQSDSGETRPWDFLVQTGPIITTAIHAGHTIRDELQPWLEISDMDRLREEDPLTDYFLPVGDSLLRVNRSRFEVDLNRPRDKAISTNAEDLWGLHVWSPDLPQEQIEKSMQLHDQFYAMVRDHCDKMIARYGHIMLLDIHSYNHRREGVEAPPALPDENPDIDLGATTMNHEIYGELLERFAKQLRRFPVCGKTPSVGVNIRWEDGGNFPEWLHNIYGDQACIITLEYKKSFMDEWTGEADILALQCLREGLSHAVNEARIYFQQMARSIA
ncbi:N-formylglutamate amidohydrolase [Parasphingorhabdus sp.]|uniref:N-formylglutamate amidohydrolase n=1 Tax=Parasphingorhabdus sp. TaxID=2709688 RepID=UPI002F95454B